MVDRKRAFIMAFMTENRSSIIHFYPLFFLSIHIYTYSPINQSMSRSIRYNARKREFFYCDVTPQLEDKLTDGECKQACNLCELPLFNLCNNLMEE